jgi:hypothetical protein
MKWKNIASDTSVFFVTATITQWRPLPAHVYARNLLPKDLEFCRQKYGCRIPTYVIMPIYTQHCCEAKPGQRTRPVAVVELA